MTIESPTQLEKSLVSEWTSRASRDDEAAWRAFTRWIDGDALDAVATELARTAARQLADDDDRIRAVLGHCPKPIAVLDADGSIVGFNRAFRALAGSTAQLGASIVPAISTEDRPLFDEVLSSAGTSQRAGATLRMESDGASRDVEFLASTIPDAVGISKGIVLAVDDRTSALLREGEESSTLATIAFADREAALALAAATLIHDIGNLVSSATVALTVVADARGNGVRLDDPHASTLFDDARTSLDHANRILRDARDVVSGRSRGIGASCSVDEAVTAVSRLREREFRRTRVRFDVKIERGLEVAIASSELKQVLANLVDNGLHAIEDGNAPGVMSLLAESVYVDGERMAALHVRDDGIGIEPGRLVHIFDPFETSRAGRGGTGLGLAIVKRVVEGAGGRVHVVSLPNRGTEVVVHLPTA